MGDPTFAVAQELGLSPDALYRHQKNHAVPTTRALSATRAAAAGQAVVILPPSREGGRPKQVLADLPTLEGVAADLAALKSRAEAILDDAEQEGAIHGRVAATGALVAVLDRLGKVAQLLAPPAPAAPTDAGAEVATVVLAELQALDPDMAQLLADRLAAYLDGGHRDAA
jgi:hypothetical protein